MGERDSITTGARKAGRELALAVMCALEAVESDDVAARAEATALTLSKPPRGDGPGEEAFEQLVRSKAARRFAQGLLARFSTQRAEIDALIDGVSTRWRLARMDQVDRNVIRLAAVELSADGTPRGVVLAEAVRLARRYGSERSARFVNGIVESVALRLRDAPEGAAGEVSGPRPERK